MQHSAVTMAALVRAPRNVDPAVNQGLALRVLPDTTNKHGSTQLFTLTNDTPFMIPHLFMC